jgi:hypothetical protein
MMSIWTKEKHSGSARDRKTQYSPSSFLCSAAIKSIGYNSNEAGVVEKARFKSDSRIYFLFFREDKEKSQTSLQGLNS